jgi:hypothetical protein
MKESTIQQQICEYLSIHGIFFFAIQNENLMMMIKMFKVPERAGYALVSHSKKMGMVPGMPDLCIILEGNYKPVFMEVKNENGEVSKQQKIIHAALFNLGFFVHIVRSVEDVENVLKKYEWRAYP